MALNGMAFGLATPHGRMMATVLIQERIRSGLAAAKARGKRLGRQPGHGPIRLTATVGQDPVSAEIVREEPMKGELKPAEK